MRGGLRNSCRGQHRRCIGTEKNCLAAQPLARGMLPKVFRDSAKRPGNIEVITVDESKDITGPLAIRGTRSNSSR